MTPTYAYSFRELMADITGQMLSDGFTAPIYVTMLDEKGEGIGFYLDDAGSIHDMRATSKRCARHGPPMRCRATFTDANGERHVMAILDGGPL